MQNADFGSVWVCLGVQAPATESMVIGLGLIWETLEAFSSSISSFLLMKTSRLNADYFPGVRSGFCLFCFVFLVLTQSLLQSPSEIFVTHVSSLVVSPRLRRSGRQMQTPLFQKTKSMSLKILVRLEKKLCEFCIITKKGKVGHILEPALFVEDEEERMKKKILGNLVVSQLLKPDWRHQSRGVWHTPLRWGSQQAYETFVEPGSDSETPNKGSAWNR